MRAGILGNTSFSASVTFIGRFSRLTLSSMCGLERAGFPFKFHCHFNGAAAGIDDGTDFHDSDLILLAGQIGKPLLTVPLTLFGFAR